MFLGQDRGRIRHFDRIQQTASSPDKVALEGGRKLVETSVPIATTNQATARTVTYDQAYESFYSRLWEFLRKRDIPTRSYTDFIQEYVAAKGWFRASNRDGALILMFLGPNDPAVEPGASTACSAMLHRLADEATPDAIAVLVALREALNSRQLEKAILDQVRAHVWSMGPAAAR